MGARVSCKSAQFNGKLRLLGRLAGYELTSTAEFDMNKLKLDNWSVGQRIIAGNVSAHLKLYQDKSVLSTRHRIHPRFVTLAESSVPYKKQQPRRLHSSVSLGFEFELSSRASLEVMVSDSWNPTFALQYQFAEPQCLLRVYRDAFSNRTGVSFSFHPCSSS
ncbi:unnamed protein product [Microthlaspi erraticum]|uniref:Uncharacterized protein n=1 Tax=Microthlaspi erraticum TaxID=1685480 RepID=A0A6D2KC99_9BRAS|nr:unnamed protein product [Microthlaspi erraticum]